MLLRRYHKKTIVEKSIVEKPKEVVPTKKAKPQKEEVKKGDNTRKTSKSKK